MIICEFYNINNANDIYLLTLDPFRPSPSPSSAAICPIMYTADTTTRSSGCPGGWRMRRISIPGSCVGRTCGSRRPDGRTTAAAAAAALLGTAYDCCCRTGRDRATNVNDAHCESVSSRRRRASRRPPSERIRSDARRRRGDRVRMRTYSRAYIRGSHYVYTRVLCIMYSYDEGRARARSR